MVIKLLTIDLHLPGRSSLKEKRFVLSSIKTKLGRQVSTAVAEVGYQDKWQRALLAVVVVGCDRAIVDATCQKTLRLFENDHRVMILDSSVEER